MQKIGGAHLNYLNNHYTKFEHKGMNTTKLQITQIRYPKLLQMVGWTDEQMDGVDPLLDLLSLKRRR